MNDVVRGSRVLNEWRAGRERERMAQRIRDERQAALKAMQRSFSGGTNTRLFGGFGSPNTGINVDLEARLGSLRAAARDLCQNTGMGRRFEGLVRRNVVGPAGMRLQVRAKLGGQGGNAGALDEAANSAVERHWAAWCEIGTCDVTETLSFRELCKLVVACLARDGEYLVRRVRSTSFVYGYRLQVLDVDRLDLTHNVRAAGPGSNTIRMGVEITPEGRPVAYHLTTYHPGDPGSQPVVRRERVPASDIFHGFIAVRPEQVRGFPWLHAVMGRVNMLDGFQEAAVIAARVGASQMGFFTQEQTGPTINADDLADSSDATAGLSREVEPGRFDVLPPGVDFKSFNPDYPHGNYDPFVTSAQRDIASGLDLAAHNLTGNMRDVNYSSARIAELAERDVWRDLQEWFKEVFLRRVYRDWLGLALLNRAITLDSGSALPADRLLKFYTASSFQARGWTWVDPKNEAEAAVVAINNRMRSRRAVVEEQGGDLEDIRDDIVAENQLFAGLPPIAASAAPAPSPAPTDTGAKP